MALNNYEAMRFIQRVRDLPLTPEIVFELHRIVTDKTLDDPSLAGSLRAPADTVQVIDDEGQILHDPPPAEELPERLHRLIDFANVDDTEGGWIHPIIRAIVLHFMLAYDHPFVDGNGRTARALFYWKAVRSGYPLIEFVSISSVIRRSQRAYARAYLHTETDDNDLTYFLVNQMRTLRLATERALAYVRRKTDESIAVERLLEGTPFRNRFNFRQLELLRRSIRAPGERFTIAGHRRRCGVSYLTARKDLEGLSEAGLLLKIERTRPHLYVVPGDLERRMRTGARRRSG